MRKAAVSIRARGSLASYPRPADVLRTGNDSVSATRQAPSALEGQARHEHSEEHWLFVTADHAVPYPGPDEGQEGEPGPPDDQAVRLTSPPEVDHAPAPGGQCSRPVDRQIRPCGQVRGDAQSAMTATM